MSQEIPCLISSPTNILTLQDVVLDSPVWRANMLHLQDQIDQFEKWIDSFLRALKSYIEALVKYNTQATTLCKKTFFNGLDGTLIDAKIAGHVVSQFATTLQSMVAYKMKTVSDLEDQLYNPLQKMVKNDLKNFKDSRKQFEKILDKYEGQLNRYNMLSKQKEVSALREDAFQMYEVRKLYVKTSTDYFSRLVSFKSNLENVLVECFSSALNTHVEEMDASVYTCTTVKSNLPGWKQWLEQNTSTCEYQINRMNQRCHELQELYIQQVKPSRQLKRYSTTSNDVMSAVSPEDDEEEEDDALASLDVNTVNTMKNAPSITIHEKSGNKEGYLNCRILPTGKSVRPLWTRKWVVLHLGWLGTCTVSTVNKEKGCIVLAERVNITECVFRVCTEQDKRYCFEVVHPKCVYYLQAETEQELQQWLWAIEYNMESTSTPVQQEIKSTLPQVLLSPHAIMSSAVKNNNTESSPRFIAMSTSPLPSPDGSQPLDSCLAPMITTTSSSLTDLMIREGDDYTIIPEHTTPTTSTISHQLSSWGMPWLTNGLSSALSNTMEEDNNTIPPSPTTTRQQQQQLIIWPNKLEMNVPIPQLSHYSTELETSQKELRKLFDHVPKEDIVLDAFLASLYKTSREGVPLSYSGHVYVTQYSLWFYSCTMMTCVHMMVIPLTKMDNLQLENNILVIDIASMSCSLGLWLESPEVVWERLKLMVDHVKKEEEIDVQSMYDAIRTIKPNKRNKTPASHVTTSSTLYATVTPVNVQAHQVMQKTSSSSTTGSMVENEPSNEEQEQQHQGSPAQGALTAVYQHAVKQKQQQQQQKRRSISPSPPPPTEEEEQWPSHIPKPKKEAKCHCTDHLDKIEFDSVFSISAKKLYKLMSTNDLWNTLNKQKNYGEPTFTDWKEGKDVMKERTMSYIMPVNNPMVKAKETDVIETQQLLEYQEYVSYVLMMMTRTPNLPYADAFIPCIKYCITYVTPTSCRLVVSIGVNWLKSIFVKGMVNRAATKGMQETVQALIPLLKQHIQQSNSSKSSSSEKKTRNEMIPATEEKKKPIPPPKDSNTATKKQNGLTVLFGVICILFALYQYWTSRRYQDNLHHLYQNNSMCWRGVYLRDIQDEITEKEATLNQVNYHTYSLFQQSRHEPWFSKQHKWIAQELGYSRERLGSIRYELLSTFRILNHIEYQLIENEYLNWLGDQHLKCQHNNSQEEELCLEFQQEISNSTF